MAKPRTGFVNLVVRRIDNPELLEGVVPDSLKAKKRQKQHR